jgi:hypothetical protein
MKPTGYQKTVSKIAMLLAVVCIQSVLALGSSPFRRGADSLTRPVISGPGCCM